jgi:hypothetical protein
MADQSHNLAQLFHFGHGPIFDPATLVLKDRLSDAALREVAGHYLDHQKAMLQAHMKLVENLQAAHAKAAK